MRVLIGAAALASVTPSAVAQDERPPQEQKGHAQDTFFSGNVVSVSADNVTVTRRTLTLTWVTKTFLLDAETKVEGNLRPKARVTVKFEKTDDGDRAVHIIVR